MSDNITREVGGEEVATGARLREARTYLGLTQEFVAEQLSIPRPAVGQIERGTRRVSGTELKRLSVLYGRPVGWLVGVGDESLGGSGNAAALYRATLGLDDDDLQEVVRFAEFLRSRSRAAGER